MLSITLNVIISLITNLENSLQGEKCAICIAKEPTRQQTLGPNASAKPSLVRAAFLAPELFRPAFS